ncbi:MAG TPA: DUF480 domain-containing protein [Pirellulales bacterium]
MNDSDPQGTPPSPGSPVAAPRAPAPWKPLGARERRILGVLVEKAKTTPDVYPMSLNALRSGANQKNNRYPLMELDNDDIEQSLERLRELGAVSEVQGDSRVLRYRHLLYDWLGVDKIELAVMAELLLRGAQTEGDLRARAARMDPIPDLSTLRNVVAALKGRGLVVGLTPDGRGHVVTHALYGPAEMEKLRAEFRGQSSGERPSSEPDAASKSVASPAASHAAASAATGSVAVPRSFTPAPSPPASPGLSAVDRAAASELAGTVAMLRSEVDELRGELDRLRREMDDLLAQLR